MVGRNGGKHELCDVPHAPRQKGNLTVLHRALQFAGVQGNVPDSCHRVNEVVRVEILLYLASFPDLLAVRGDIRLDKLENPLEMGKGSPEEPYGEDFVTMLRKTFASPVEIQCRKISLICVGETGLEIAEIQVAGKHLNIRIILVVHDPSGSCRVHRSLRPTIEIRRGPKDLPRQHPRAPSRRLN